MTPKASCQNCGTSIPSNAPAGICPRCTLALAMGRPQPTRDSLASTALGASFVAPQPSDLQHRFENLEIIELLGHGGMGAVYKARQKNLDRIVALKILSPNLTNDPSFAQRFTREARTLAKLTHPNIVMVFEFGTVDDLHYLLMEFVDGVDLRTAMRDESLQPDQALSVVQQVCEALQYAHDQGIVHRDIKPENILLGRNSAVKIADFGLAKLVQSDSYEQSLTGTQQVVGTRNYMAPEQIEKPTKVDHRADIYSLGVVFYELLTGELPLGRFAAPSEKAHVNASLDDVVMRALEKEPDKRYQQASQVQTAVESIESQPYATPESQPDESVAANPTGHVLRVPFSIPQMYHGFAVALGIAHFDGSVIELEFEVRDDVLGAMKSRPHRVTIPVNELLDAKHKAGAFSDRLTVKAAHLETVSDVPNNQHGQFVLHIKKEHREQAKLLADAVAKSIRKGPGPVERVPKEKPAEPEKPWHKVLDARIGAAVLWPRAERESPLQAGPRTSPDYDFAAQNMRGPALGLLATGIVNALIAVALWISFMVGALSWVGSLSDSSSSDSPSSSSISISSNDSDGEATLVAEASSATEDEVNADNDILPIRWVKKLIHRFKDFSFRTLIFSTAMAVLLVFASMRMMQLKDYQFCVFASV
ncbi:MAG: serine/threonine-protein kinase, partial [Pirellulaceae bacterium]